jgi:hypothetical protein
MDRDNPEHEIDVWLDQALARYNAAEPRAGLEKRVLESLRAEKRGLSGRWRKAWVPALATAAAAIVVVVVVVRSHDSSSGRAVAPEVAPEHAPAAPAGTGAGERQPEATVDHGSPATTGESSPRKPAGTMQAGPERGVSALAEAGGPGSAKAGSGAVRRARAATRVDPSPHPASVFPVPAPLSEQERLALAAARSGLLPTVQPEIPPAGEPLPQVVIQEIRIRPLQELKPI